MATDSDEDVPTLFAVFTSSDGSPAFREWQDRHETEGAFVVRMQDILANDGGYLTCSGIWRCVTTKDADLSRAVQVSGGNGPADGK
jgi:hypothetical protein